MNVLIIGYWEIWQAISQIETETNHVVYVYDKKQNEEFTYPSDIWLIHICFWYQKWFMKKIKKYTKQFNCNKVIIHSTIPYWLEYWEYIAHSPVIWVHPNLYEWIKTFTKYCNRKRAVKYLNTIWLKSKYMKWTELAKVLSTTYYWWNILYSKMVEWFCYKYKLDYNDIYVKRNNNYNKGYKKLGKSNVIRPVLMPFQKKIWWHCIINNIKLLPLNILKLSFRFIYNLLKWK